MNVIVLHKTTPLLPMRVTEKHIAQISDVCGGQVDMFETEEELLESGKSAPILLTWGGSGKMPEEYCRRAENLKLIHSLSAGVDPMQSGPIWNLPVQITTSSGIHGLAMSEHVMGMILSWNRRFPFFATKQREHIWGKGLSEPLQDTAGKTVGIIGAGKIGTAIAEKCKAFDMHTIGLRRHPVPTSGFDEMLPRDKLPDLLSRADFAVLITPLTEETRGMIGEAEFHQMKQSALFINIGRGAVVDTEAMIKALQDNEIAGAAIDAFTLEPLPAESGLWDIKNLIITPHVAAVSPGNTNRAVDIFCENIRRFLSGEPLINKVK